MQSIDYQQLVGGGGVPYRPPKEVIDLKAKAYSRQYWKRELTALNSLQRISLVFVLCIYFEYYRTDCADLLQVDRRTIHRDLKYADDLIRYPAIYRQMSARFLAEIKRIYNYI